MQRAKCAHSARARFIDAETPDESERQPASRDLLMRYLKATYGADVVRLYLDHARAARAC